MTTQRDGDAARLRKQLRAAIQRGDEAIEVPAEQARSLVDELGRLLQSNDRLRRQNRRLRRRLQSAGLEAGEDGVGASEAVADDSLDVDAIGAGDDDLGRDSDPDGEVREERTP